MDTKTFVHSDGRDRVVTSVESAVNANADGFYDPESPSGARIVKLRQEAGETPSESWTHKRLDEYAATRNVSFGDDVKTKADKVAALTASSTQVDNGSGVETPELTTADRRVASEAPATDATATP